MRISDWSSDVCSSDLFRPVPELREARRGLRRRREGAARRARRDRHPEPADGGRGMSSFARTDTSLMGRWWRSEEHTSELQSLMRISYAVFCLKKKTTNHSDHDFANRHERRYPT